MFCKTTTKKSVFGNHLLAFNQNDVRVAAFWGKAGKQFSLINRLSDGKLHL